MRFVPFADEALSFDASFLRRMDVLARRRGAEHRGAQVSSVVPENSPSPAIRQAAKILIYVN